MLNFLKILDISLVRPLISYILANKPSSIFSSVNEGFYIYCPISQGKKMALTTVAFSLFLTFFFSYV